MIRARLAVLLLWMLPLAAPAQVNDPAYADYFLVGRFGEICTMCEVIVLCEKGEPIDHDAIPRDGDFTLYHIRTRTFWSQISTIWEWFLANLDPESLKAGHSRPVDVYTVEDGDWPPVRTVDAQVSLDPAEIVLAERVIDRVERRWLRANDAAAVGYCQRLPLWDSIETIEARTGAAGR